MARILIIDDDAQVRNVVGEFLRRHGHDVVAASNGSEGLQAAAASTPELILCDLDMPALDGNQVVSALRKDDQLAEVPVIFLSGCSDREQIRRSMNLGADDFLVKPSPLAEILEAVNAKLARRQDHRQRQEKRMRKAVEVFVGIVHDLNQGGGEIRWMAQKSVGSDGREVAVAEQPAPVSGEKAPPGASAPAAGADSVLVTHNNRRQFLKISEVKALLADGEYSTVYWGKGQRMMFRKSLKQWLVELPARQFVQVHRSAIVNLAHLDFVEKVAEGGLQIHIRDLKDVIPVSQRSAPFFNRCLKEYQPH